MVKSRYPEKLRVQRTARYSHSPRRDQRPAGGLARTTDRFLFASMPPRAEIPVIENLPRCFNHKQAIVRFGI